MSTYLVERAQQGDKGAFTDLVHAYGNRCYAIAYRMLRDTERAQDAVQQAFFRAWRDLPRLREVERFEAWLHRLVVNACYDEARRHRRWSNVVRPLYAEDAGGTDPAVAAGDRDALERAFARLSPEHRAVFVLHHDTGMPLAAIADVVGVPLGTVKSRLFHATRQLRAAVSGDGHTEAAEARTA